MNITQLNIFQEENTASARKHDLNRENLGTFQDSLRAPVHRWFTYPAGFSFKAVEKAFRVYNIRPGMTVYDPFAGTATTNIVAQQHGIRSFGVEAHPFVHFVGATKLFWDFASPGLLHQIDELLERIKNAIQQRDMATLPIQDIFPALVYKCYSREKLACLYVCREVIKALPAGPFRNFAKLGLTNLLRSIADVATGWPYIAPQKAKKNGNGSSMKVIEKLRDQLYQMYGDLREVQRTVQRRVQATFILGDSRRRQDAIENGAVDLVFTSPPYLNNYDYSDRTRLEMYFWGEASSWHDITQKVRSQLIMSATTQIVRSGYQEGALVKDDFCRRVPDVAVELRPKVEELTQRRLQKGGKKSYDIMVAGYFQDMLQVLQETYRVLKPGGVFLLILGDSAPYGVHIPTDIYLGEIGKAVGFTRYSIEDLRTRGGKWRDNPQRHKVALKESILLLEKG
ncbi:MAG: hypothetical protein IMW89_13505 [Ktedonobacteraceae bacterium]|nr:hypothetical protein [Ktedonobacteraceae bacterium]